MTTDLPALALIPFFCDPSVQYVLILRAPKGVKLDRKALKVKFTLVSEADGEVIVTVPGDGIYPSLLLFSNVSAAMAQAAPTGTAFELRAGNLGKVNRDWAVRAETSSSAGDHRYVGTIGEGAALRVEAAYPAVDADAMRAACDIARAVLTGGPWEMSSRDEAAAIVRDIIDRRSANINDAFIRSVVRVEGSRIVTQPIFAKPPSKHFALGMAVFRKRFWDGPWDVRTVAAVDYYGMTTEEQKDALMKVVLGG